jgi:hypothetical protein
MLRFPLVCYYITLHSRYKPVYQTLVIHASPFFLFCYYHALYVCNVILLCLPDNRNIHQLIAWYSTYIFTYAHYRGNYTSNSSHCFLFLFSLGHGSNFGQWSAAPHLSCVCLPHNFLIHYIVLLLIVEYSKVWFRASFQWHNTHSKFHHNLFNGSRVETHEQTDGQVFGWTWPAHSVFSPCTSCKEHIININ